MARAVEKLESLQSCLSATGFLGRVRAGCLHKPSSASRDRQTDVDTSTGEIINARPRRNGQTVAEAETIGAQRQHP